MGDIVDMFHFAEEDRLAKTGILSITDPTPASLDFSIVPPFSSEAEKALLAAILSKPSEVLPICTEKGLNAEDFFHSVYRRIFRAALDLWDSASPFDVLLVAERLETSGIVIGSGVHDFVKRLADIATVGASFRSYIDIIIEKSRLRQLTSVLKAGADQCASPGAAADDVIAQLRSSLASLTKVSQSDSGQSMKDHVMNAIEAIEQVYEARGTISGFSSGFDELDQATSGFQQGNVTCFVGSSATSLVLNVVAHIVVKLKRAVGLFSLATPAANMVQRLLCCKAGVSLKEIRLGRLRESDFPALCAAASKLAETHLYVDDTSALTLAQLESRIRRLSETRSVEVVIIDRAELLKLDAETPSNDFDTILTVCKALKTVARETRVTILVTIAVSGSVGGSRSFDQHEGRITGWYQGLAEVCDVVLQLSVPEEVDGEELVNVTVHTTAHIGPEEFPLSYRSSYERFTSLGEEIEVPESKWTDGRPCGALAYDIAARQYHHLIDKRFLGTLTDDEEAVLEKLTSDLDNRDFEDEELVRSLEEGMAKSEEVSKVLIEVRKYLEAFLKKA
jgi:replicative DNA helicase